MNITKTNNAPRNIFVLTMANISSAFESFIEKIWVTIRVIAIKPIIISKEKKARVIEIIKNQNENPAVTASALKRVDDNSILYRINECNQSALC